MSFWTHQTLCGSLEPRVLPCIAHTRVLLLAGTQPQVWHTAQGVLPLDQTELFPAIFCGYWDQHRNHLGLKSFFLVCFFLSEKLEIPSVMLRWCSALNSSISFLHRTSSILNRSFGDPNNTAHKYFTITPNVNYKCRGSVAAIALPVAAIALPQPPIYLKLTWKKLASQMA